MRVVMPTYDQLAAMYPNFQVEDRTSSATPTVPQATQKESVDRRDAFVPGRLIDLDE
jgi:hypothetical protein